MQVKITSHCLERFEERNFGKKLDPEYLVECIAKGRLIKTRPGNAYETEVVIDRDKHYFVLVKQKEEYLAVTYLGDELYRKWFFRTGVKAKYKNVRKKNMFRPYREIDLPVLFG